MTSRDYFNSDVVEFEQIKNIMRSALFCPTYIHGLSGSGKTSSVIAAAAECSKSIIRVNFTEETSERDLIGGWHLKNGNTIWEDGPVIRAMGLNSVLLLDEVDLAGPRTMCLQSILEGSDYFIKQTGRLVIRSEGFRIFATGNTRGSLTDDNRFKFAHTKIQNEAFLDRFDFYIEYAYPSKGAEHEIIIREMLIKNSELARDLVEWANQTRSAYKKGNCGELISTRRLKAVIKYTNIFGYDNIENAIDSVLNRFDLDTKESFKRLFVLIRK